VIAVVVGLLLVAGAPAPVPQLVLQHKDVVRDIALSPDGKTRAASAGEVIVLWDFPAGRKRSVLSGHRQNVYGVEFSPDGKTLASAGSDDMTVKVWDVAALRRGDLFGRRRQR